MAIETNHPFIDGNKRNGFLAAYTFLGINGFHLKASEEDAAVHSLAPADSRVSNAELSHWLSRNCSTRK